MAYPIHHGIQLAANSSIVNAVIENLAADPVPLQTGRVWYNTTEKRYKISSLNSSGAVIVESFPFKSELDAAIASLTKTINDNNTATTDAINNVKSLVDTTNSDVTALATRVTTVESTYINKDGSVAFTHDVNLGGNKLLNVANGVAASDAVNLSQLTAAISALGSVFEYVGTLDVSKQSNLDSLTKKENGDTYRVIAGGTFNFTDADKKAQTLFVNTGDLIVFSNGLPEKIDSTNSQVAGTATFINVTGSSDTGFTIDIDSAFKNRVTAVESGLASEIDRANKAEGALDNRVTTVESQVNGKIGDLTTLSTSAKDTLVNAINSVKSDVNNASSDQTKAISDLKTAINAKNFFYISNGASKTHTVAHNFNTNKLLYTVMVKNSDGIYCNDIVPVSETDSNTLSITLSEARDIKVIVQSLEALV
jgi:flagellar hook-basal body complex protein FliE